MLVMPATPATGLSRVVLVEDKPAAAPRGAGRDVRIRRYRLARLEVEARDGRFSHLRESHD